MMAIIQGNHLGIDYRAESGKRIKNILRWRYRFTGPPPGPGRPGIQVEGYMSAPNAEEAGSRLRYVIEKALLRSAGITNNEKVA